MAQFARPVSDRVAGPWTDEGVVDNDGNLYTSVDEVTQDGDSSYIQATTTGTGGVNLGSITDPGVDTGHVLHILYRNIGSGGPERIDFELYTNNGTTLVTSITNQSNRSGTYIDLAYPLSEAEAAIIGNSGDYSSLVVYFIVTALGGGESFRITQVFLQTPDAIVKTYNQSHFRIRSDDSQLLNANTGWADAEDVNASIGRGVLFRIRLKVTETGGGGSAGAGIKLQVNRNSAGWVDVDIIGGLTTPAVLVQPSAQYADGDPTSTELLTNDGGTYISGTGEEDNSVTTSVDNSESEIEFCLQIMSTHDGFLENIAGTTLQFRLVEADGTPFTGTYVIPTITVTDTPGYIGGCHVEGPVRIGPFKDSNGNLYYITEYAETANYVAMHKSTDGGDTWRVMDGANRPTTNDWECADIQQDGDTLHILLVTGSCTYHTFRTSDHPTNPDTWGITDEIVDDTITGHTSQAGALAKRSNGTIVALYLDDVTPDRVWYKIRSAGGVWGGRNAIDTEAGVNFVSGWCVLGASDLVHIFYKDDDNGIIYHRTLNSSDVLSGRDTVITGISTLDTHDDMPFLEPVYWDDGGNEKIMICYQKVQDGPVFTKVYTNNSIGSEAQASDNNVSTDQGANHMVIGSLVADQNSKTVYILYAAEDLSRNLYRDENVNEGGWGTDVLEASPTELHWVRGWVFTHSPGNGGAKVLGYVLDDNSAGGTGQIWYAEYVLSAGGAFVNIAAAAVSGSATPDTSVLAVLRKYLSTVVSASATPDTATLAVLREYLGAAAASSSTPDIVPLVLIKLFASAVLAQSTTPAVALEVVRAMLGFAIGASSIPDVAEILVMREMLGSAEVVSSTPSTILAVLRELVSAASADSVTPDSVTLDIATVVQFTAAVLAATTTPSVALTVLREMVAVALSASTTPDTTILAVVRGLLASVTAQTITPAAALEIIREMLGSSSSVSVTPDSVSLDIGAIVSLVAAAVAQSNTSTITITVLREILATLLGSSNTPDIVNLDVAGTITFLASAMAASDTPDIVVLQGLMEFAGSALAQSSTPDTISLLITVNLLAQSIAQSNNGPVTLTVLREMAASASAQTGVSDVAILAVIFTLAAAIQAGSITPDTVNLAISLIVGKISMTFSVKQPGLTYSATKPSITFEE